MQIALACKTLPTMPHKWCAWMSKCNECIKKIHTDKVQRKVWVMSTFLKCSLSTMTFLGFFCYSTHFPSSSFSHFACRNLAMSSACSRYSHWRNYRAVNIEVFLFRTQDTLLNFRPSQMSSFYYKGTYLWELHKQKALFSAIQAIGIYSLNLWWVLVWLIPQNTSDYFKNSDSSISLSL